MLCSKSFELVKQLDAGLTTCHELSAYNEDNVRFAFEECKTLFAQNQVDVQPVLQGKIVWLTVFVVVIRRD